MHHKRRERKKTSLYTGRERERERERTGRERQRETERGSTCEQHI